jgi:hypothetical protein
VGTSLWEEPERWVDPRSGEELFVDTTGDDRCARAIKEDQPAHSDGIAPADGYDAVKVCSARRA